MMDIKSTLYDTCAPFLQEAGYRTIILDFREVGRSLHYNLMYKINREMDKYLAASSPAEKAMHYGAAERYAKVLAESLFDNTDSASVSSESGNYFRDTAKGLIAGIILLVSEYAAPAERHIISVFSLILEFNGQTPAPTGLFGGAPQKSKLEALLENLPNARLRNYTGAATSADMRTLMNVFSSALSTLTRFIDAELEQILCDHSPELDDLEFIEEPTAIFISCPDENTTRHFFASLFIRFFSNDLIEQSSRYPDRKLPRPVLYFCDEFGNTPPINDVDVLFSAVRSRGVRIMIALQSYGQLYKHYSKEKARIVMESCQMLTFGFVSPNAHETAKQLSDMLGNETVLSGSVTFGRGSVGQTTQSMVGRPLVAVSELVTLPHGTFIIQKSGVKPLRTEMQMYFQYLKDIHPIEPSDET